MARGGVKRGRHPSWDKHRSVDRCVRCKQDWRRHSGRGLCTACYDHVRRYDPTWRRITKVLKQRLRNGVMEYRCTKCLTWKQEDGFYIYKSGHGGWCRECKKAHHGAWRKAHAAARRAAAAEQTRLEHEADEAHRRAFLVDRFVPSARVAEWVEQGVKEHGTLEQLAFVAGTTSRSIFRATREQDQVTAQLAEKIALAVGGQAVDELDELLPPLGKDGWGPNGARNCERCGTWWRPHHGMGFCKRCYHADWRARRAGRPVTLPVGSWSMYHACCVECGRTKVRHHGHGLCGSCYGKRRHARSKVAVRAEK